MALRSREAAVMCWFPTGDKWPIPVSIKFLDDDDIIISVREIDIISANVIMQGREYKCKAEIGGVLRQFALTFFAESCKWYLKI